MKQRRFAPAMPLPEFGRSRANEEVVAASETATGGEATKEPNGMPVARERALTNEMPAGNQGHEVPMHSPGAKLPADDIQALVRIPLSHLEATEWNSRWLRTPQRIHELMEELKADGQRLPVTVAERADKPGYYLVIDGQTRFVSASNLGWVDLLCVIDRSVNTASPVEVYKASKRLNGQEPLNDIDCGLTWARMIKEGVATVEQLSIVEGVSPQQIYRKLAYADLPDAVMEVVCSSPTHFPSSIAAELKTLLNDLNHHQDVVLRVRAFAEQIVADDMSRRQVSQQRERLVESLAKPSVQRKRDRRTSLLPVEVGGTRLGEFATFEGKDGEGGSVKMKIEGLDGLMMAEVKSTIGDLIEKLKVMQERRD